MKDKNIVYVNFAQYDNTGRILDFLVDNFSVVIHFSYDHLRLKHGRASSYLRVYKKAKKVYEIKLIHLRAPSALLFPSLPLVALWMLIQTIWYTWKLKRKYKRIDYYLTLNAYSAWIGNILRDIRLIGKSIFWVGDYFPVQKYPDIRMKFVRWVYWLFDKPSMQRANKLIFTNDRLQKLYKKMGFLPTKNTFDVIPIGTTLASMEIEQKRNLIGFLGMIKSSQGLELLFNSLPKLFKKYPDAVFEIVGSGPEEEKFVKQAKMYANRVKFYGFIEDQDRILKITRRWAIGLAPYKPEVSNESYWGDPSKIKVYLSVGVPVITTDVSYMADIIRMEKAGKVVDYTVESFLKGIHAIFTDKKRYGIAAHRLAKKYYYKVLYPRIFYFHHEK